MAPPRYPSISLTRSEGLAVLDDASRKPLEDFEYQCSIDDMIRYLPCSTPAQQHGRESLRSLDSAPTIELPLLVFIFFAAYLLNADRLLVIGLVNGLKSPGV